MSGKRVTGWPRKVTTGQWALVRWRVSSRQPEKPLANELLFGSLVDGGQVTVALDKEKNELTYGFQSAQKHKAEAAH